MLHSVIGQAAPYRVHAHYLHGPGFPRRSVTRLHRMAGELGAVLSFHEIDPRRVVGLPIVRQFTAAMWYRIFLPEIVQAGRVLYLDVDTIVVDALPPLWQTNLDGCYLGAVTNVFEHEYVHRPASLGLSGPEVYFNSGVLLMNLDEMRNDDCTAALHDYATAHPKLEWPDQDALNVVLGGKRRSLHPRWNFMNSMRFPWAAEVFGHDVLEEARARPAIRHFEGPGDNKPWHPGRISDDREIYLAHLAQTPWRRLRLEVIGRRKLRRLARAARSL